MTQTKNCPHCNTPFTGRANRIYCSDSCKNQKNNTRDTALRKDSRFFANVMERNERILRAFMARPAVSKDTITQRELKELGFNLAGPFILHDGGFLVGEFILKEYMTAFYKIVKLDKPLNAAYYLDYLFPSKPKV